MLGDNHLITFDSILIVTFSKIKEINIALRLLSFKQFPTNHAIDWMKRSLINCRDHAFICTLMVINQNIFQISPNLKQSNHSSTHLASDFTAFVQLLAEFSSGKRLRNGDG